MLEHRRRRSRYAVVYDTSGPRVRLGILWFGLLAGACALQVFGRGVVALGLLFTVVVVVAGLQTAGCWLAVGAHPHQAVAGSVAGIATVVAIANTALVGVAVLALVVAALAAAVLERTTQRDPVVDAGDTVRCALFAVLGGASPILIARHEVGAVITLLALVSIYEMGDYLVGSGSANPIEGPLAGILGVAALTFALSVAVPPPFVNARQVFTFGVLVAVLAPVGQMVASAVLPRSGAPAPALRRLDSLIVVGPVWVVLLWTIA